MMNEVGPAQSRAWRYLRGMERCAEFFPHITQRWGDSVVGRGHLALICAVAEELFQEPPNLGPVDVRQTRVLTELVGVRELDRCMHDLLMHRTFTHLSSTAGVLRRANADHHTLGDTWQGKPVDALYACLSTPAWPGGWSLLSAMFPSIYPTDSRLDYVASPSARMHTIDSADAWLELHKSHGRELPQGYHGLAWDRIAEDWDCVNILAGAVIAIDHWTLASSDMLIRPTVWTVPTSVWLDPSRLVVIDD